VADQPDRFMGERTGDAVLTAERHDEVYVITIDDGENRFNADSIAAWHAALDEVGAVEGPVALVTTGTGKFYSNGLDLDWLMGDGGGDGPAFMIELHRLFARVLTAGYATVAAINGHAFAAGAMLTTAHDLKVMRSDRGYWCLPEVDLGMPLTPGMNALLTARMPVAAAHEALVTGRRFSGDDALAVGIVDEVAGEDAVLDRACELAAPLASKHSNALSQIKHDLYADAVRILTPEAMPA
jgi:enoyl-CoA hydratase/carnithine racemase